MKSFLKNSAVLKASLAGLLALAHTGCEPAGNPDDVGLHLRCDKEPKHKHSHLFGHFGELDIDHDEQTSDGGHCTPFFFPGDFDLPKGCPSASPSPGASGSPSPGPTTSPSSIPSTSNGCFVQSYQQDQAKTKVTALDVLFVVDSSGSLNDERKGVIDNLDHFIDELPQDLDIQFGIILGHSSKSKYAGQFYGAEKAYTFLNTKKHSRATIKKKLNASMANPPTDGYADGGEELFYSLNKALDSALKSRSNCNLFFRPNAGLSVIFVSDENEISTFPRSKVYDPDKKEGPAYNRDYKNSGITTTNLINKVKKIVGPRPYIFGGIVYSDDKTYPRVGENELGLGYLDLLAEGGEQGVVADLALKDFTGALQNIGRAMRNQIELKSRFKLEHLPVDPASIAVEVDKKAVSFSLEGSDTVAILPGDSGASGSKIEINYCLLKPEPLKAATGLSWDHSSPTTVTSLQAQWKKSASSKLTNQLVQFYQDGSCTTPSGAALDLESSAVESQAFEALPGGQYSFKVISQSSTEEIASECSTAISVDKIHDPLLPASSLSWTESSPTSATTLHPNWTASPAADLSAASIEIYEGSQCVGAVAYREDLAVASAQSTTFSAAQRGKTYSYKVFSVNSIGETAASTCSTDLVVSAIVVPLLTPATGLGWSESSPQTVTTVHAAWTPSSSSIAASASIQFYTGGTCNAASGAPIGLASKATAQTTLLGTLGVTYSYKVITFDNQGNSIESECSPPMVINCADPFDPACSGGGTGV